MAYHPLKLTLPLQLHYPHISLRLRFSQVSPIADNTFFDQGLALVVINTSTAFIIDGWNQSFPFFSQRLLVMPARSVPP